MCGIGMSAYVLMLFLTNAISVKEVRKILKRIGLVKIMRGDIIQEIEENMKGFVTYEKYSIDDLRDIMGTAKGAKTVVRGIKVQTHQSIKKKYDRGMLRGD